jgi:two-component system KDP operon response regulator KdpE
MSEQGLRVLVIDDERAIRRFLRAALSSQNHAVTEAETGRDGLAAVGTDRPDVVILDLGLPDMDGIEVIRQLREWTTVPVIVLSVRGQEEDKVAALDAGADDYLTKPFAIGELLARIRVALRHTLRPTASPVVQVDDLQIDFEHRTVTRSGQEVHLTPTEYDVLKYLVQHAGKVVTHRMLLQEVWGPEHLDETQYLHVVISQLRRKIESQPARPRYILTEPGVGYRFRPED